MDKDFPEHTALTSDFSAWQIQNPQKIICSGKSVTEDGRLVLNLSINDTEFSLLCPADYPDHEDSFFMETECTDFWCIALNEFIIDSPEKLSLDVILAKIFLYYTPSSKKSYQSSENESENENAEDSDSDETDEWDSMISKKKREWRAKEGELRLRFNRPKISDMFDGQIMDHPQQVFSNSAASEILINDLINIMGSKESDGIVVDTVENDIRKWSVFLKDFHPQSKISEDLKETKELYGYDNVQLQLDFTMDLYPSDPPIIKFIRPKLIGVFDGKEFVKLANWNPARDMMSVLKEIKDHIDRNGRVDVDDECNGIKVPIVEKILTELANALKEEQNFPSYSSPDTRYSEKCLAGTEGSPFFKGENSEVETMLTRLLYCLKNPICKGDFTSDGPNTDSYYDFNLALNNNFCDEKYHEARLSETSSYSSCSMFQAIDRLIENEELEAKSRYETNRRVDISYDRKHCNITTNPAFGLAARFRDLTGLQNEKYSYNNVSMKDTNGTSNYSYKNSKNIFNGSERRNKTNIKDIDTSVISSFNANFRNPKGLSLIASNNPTLESNENLTRVFKILKESVLLPFIRFKLAVDPFFRIWVSTSLYSKIIEVLIDLASNPYLVELLSISDTRDRSIADLLKILGDDVRSIFEKLADLTDGHLLEQADLEKAELGKSIIGASKLIESQLTEYCGGNCLAEVVSLPNNQIRDSGPNHYDPKTLDSVYQNSLKDLKFTNCNIDLETHAFKEEYIADMNSTGNYFRMAQEFAVLSKFLPLEAGSAIFVRIDNSKPSLMRALITGMEGTCYSGGCFSFDIYLKKDYPDTGIKMRCVTFHDKEKTWCPNNLTNFSSFEEDISSHNPAVNPSTGISNILQMLTFIKNQKLIPSGVFGELDESGSKEILLTNVIRFAMINQMRKPIPGFEEVIIRHFSIKKNQILSELERFDFLKDSELLDSLKKEFDNLTIQSKSLEK